MYDENYYAKKLQEMIKVETISDPSNPNKEKFDSFHEKLRELFPLVFSRLEVKEIDSSLLIKWKGKEEGDGILLMSHQDVVPPEGEWEHEPFSGDIENGRIYGRGTMDTKGSLMCIFQSFEELLEEGFEPKYDLYIASSSTEEVSGSGAPKTVEYLKSQGVHLHFLMDEGGMVVKEPLSGVKGTYAMVGTVEKGSGNIKVIAKGNGGHASAPEKNSPIVRLSKFVVDIEEKDPNIKLMSTTLLEMFRRLGKTTKGVLGFAMRHAKGLKGILKKVLPSVSPKAGAMIKTTMAFTMCSGSKAVNVMPEEAYVNINVRYAEHQGVEETRKILEPYMEKYNLEMEFSKETRTPQKAVDFKAKPFKLIEKIVGEIYPGVITSPYVMTGGTDAYFYHDLTDNALRFAPILIDNKQLETVHAKNENIFVSSLPKAVEFYKSVLKEAENEF